MKLDLFPFLVAVTTACTFAACGGSTSDGTPTPANDAGTTDDGGSGDDGSAPDASDDAPPPVDHGKPSTTYPAYKADMPAIIRNGGSVLSAPVIVPVVWETDPNLAQIDSFIDQIGTTSYWHAVVSEYGVANATVGGHVHIPVNAGNPLPATITESALESLVDQSVGTTGWPAATSQTIYIVFPHPSIAVTGRGGAAACTLHGGYHTVTRSRGVIYALALPCTTNSANALVRVTATASHELGEAATDPSPVSGYFGFDNNHVAWSLFQRFQVENGDSCEFLKDAEYKEAAPFAFQVQRLWSNASAALGHNPCVPAGAAGPYFGVVPTALETVSTPIGGRTVMTKGINIPVGQTKTFAVGFFSEAATAPFSVHVAEAFTPNVTGAMSPSLTLSIDKTTGQNGEIAYVTVTVNKAGLTITEPSTQTFAKANYITLLSSLGNQTYFTPILITEN